MRSFLYLRLVTLTAGTLLPFFWMVVILGHRRQRNFERIFFFLCLALTAFFGASLLAVNVELYYGIPPSALEQFAWTCVCLGLWLIPSLVVHLHIEYAGIRELLPSGRPKHLWLAAAWSPTLLLMPVLIRATIPDAPKNFDSPLTSLGLSFQVWLLAGGVIGAFWQWRFERTAPDSQQRSFHSRLVGYFLNLSAGLATLVVIGHVAGSVPTILSLAVMLFAMVPLMVLIVKVQRFHFLQIGRQQNLIFAVFGVFLALLYLSFVRRATLWLEPYLPPEASAALLLFLPVVFFEPLQRLIRKLLRQTAQVEMDRVQKLMGPIHEIGRLGDPEKLRQFAEHRIGEQLQLADVQLQFDEHGPEGAGARGKNNSEERFAIGRPDHHLGTLRVRAHGAMISGETYAALEFVAEQLPAAFDLCHLIEEKLQLERELAERERMALVGQMAASISHNLKNPLGSIKTILQVQMESADLPAALRGETQMVLDEINRLGSKLNQLLQFSRPGVRPSSRDDRCDIVAVALSVAEVLCRDATSRGISLEMAPHPEACEVACSAEAARDVLSNVVLNAIEASSCAGRVLVGFPGGTDTCKVAVEDDGPGIAPDLREKVMQPFFTTKPRGTGLGLAIVARRLEEFGGQLGIDSPIANGCGTRFLVEFPLAPKERTL